MMQTKVMILFALHGWLIFLALPLLSQAQTLQPGCYTGFIRGADDQAWTPIWLAVKRSSAGNFAVREDSGAQTCGSDGTFSDSSIISYRVRPNGGNYVGPQRGLCGAIFAADVSLRQMNRNNLSYYRFERGFIGAGGGSSISRSVRGI